jgi:diguanylate cyclase (GGDEF)-like protein
MFKYIMRKADGYFDRQNKCLLFAAGLLLTIIVGFLNYLASWEFSFPILYMLLIGFAAYYCHFAAGLLLSIVSVVLWTMDEVMNDMPYTYWYAPYWNAGVRLPAFWLFSYLLSYLRKQVKLNEKLARTDPLTGVLNSRYFRELATGEMKRAVRYNHVFTIVYIDLDEFKNVNDSQGHQAGDDLLQLVARTIYTNLRATDYMARLGGDEFAIMLVETSFESAGLFLNKLGQVLRHSMQTKPCSVTFSIGAITCITIPSSIDDMIRRADSLMYSVKREGRNAMKHVVFQTEQPAAHTENLGSSSIN